MPPALIEGTESYFFFTLMIWFCEYQVFLYWFFAAGVVFTIGQRLQWAYKNLETENTGEEAHSEKTDEKISEIVSSGEMNTGDAEDDTNDNKTDNVSSDKVKKDQ